MLNPKNIKKWILKLCFNINNSNWSYTNVVLHFVYPGWFADKHLEQPPQFYDISFVN